MPGIDSFKFLKELDCVLVSTALPGDVCPAYRGSKGERVRAAR